MSVNRSTRIEILAAKAKGCQFYVLQYNRSADGLELWRWPSYGGVKIEPKDLRKHRETHYMLGPNCLCPMRDNTLPDFIEAAIYLISRGSFAGQFVASCARDKCGYFVFLEHLYNRDGLPIKSYELRPMHEQPPPIVAHGSETRPLKRTYAMLDINTPDLIPRRIAPAPTIPNRVDGRMSISNLLELLDSRVRPGVTEAEFRTLFVKCDCGYLFTRRAFKDHACAGASINLTQEEVIDLTAEN